ncbi:hypothetical protein B0O99DRAFT_745095 [Bisporella sp. PMI_857]|nr:hypothetical protein B0O99DRAFT_745095 [Bisporella sp. PMI_857]
MSVWKSLYLWSSIAIARAKPVPGYNTSEYNVSAVTNLNTRSIWEGATIPTDIRAHWAFMKGGKEGSIEHLQAHQIPPTLTGPDGKNVPLIALDCENTEKAVSGYKGNYYDICRNYLWWRNCDPSTKDRAIMPGYVQLTRGLSKSSNYRRKLGGYQWTGGPCNPTTDPEKVNKHITTKGKTSQEEFPMAFMNEGGRWVPPSRKVGDTLLKEGVARSPVFRCVDRSENSSAGSKINKQIDKRGIRHVDGLAGNNQSPPSADTNKQTSGGKGKNLISGFKDIVKGGSKKGKEPEDRKPPPKKRAGTSSGPSSRKSATSSIKSSGSADVNDYFFFDIYNYGAAIAGIDWADWNSKCENDGGQFMGLADYDEVDRAEKSKKKILGGKISLPKKKQGGADPQTPIAGNKNSGQSPQVPGAPRKKMDASAAQIYFANLDALVLKWAKSKDEAGINSETETEEEQFARIFPDSEPDDPEVKGALKELDGITHFQWYKFTSTGIKDDQKSSLKERYADTIGHLSAQTEKLKLSGPEDTPSKNPQSGPAAPVTPVKQSGKGTGGKDSKKPKKP